MKRVLIVIVSIIVITLIPLSTRNQVTSEKAKVAKSIDDLLRSANGLKEALIDINQRLEEIE